MIDASPRFRSDGNPVDCPAMKTVALTAHFDGEKFQLDEPCQLEPNARLAGFSRFGG
jgi:hypothetical protein